VGDKKSEIVETIEAIEAYKGLLSDETFMKLNVELLKITGELINYTSLPMQNDNGDAALVFARVVACGGVLTTVGAIGERLLQFMLAKLGVETVEFVLRNMKEDSTGSAADFMKTFGFTDENVN
jgi:hypothetical protein